MNHPFRLLRNCSFLLATILFMTLSCDKASQPEDSNKENNSEYSDDFVLKDGVIYVDQESTKFFLYRDEDQIVIKTEAPAALMPTIGDIILVAQNDEMPYGFLGKVLTINETAEGKELNTESVSLDEVFEELHLEKNLDIADQLDNLIDEDGNKIPVETIDNSFWLQFETEEKEELKTKAEYIKEDHSTKAISFFAPFFEGSLILSTNLYARINISRGLIQDYSIVLRAASSLSGKMKFSGNESKPFSKTVRLPGAIMVGPIALRPAIVYGITFSAEGEIKMDGPITVGLSSTTTRWENNSPGQTSIDNSHPVSCKATYLDCDGTLKMTGRIGLQFGVFGQKVLAFGIDWQPDASFGFSGEMKMKDKNTLKKRDLNLHLSGSYGSFGAYLYSKFLAHHLNDKLRISIATPEFSYVIPLLDRGKNHNCAKKTREWGVSGEFGDYELFLNVDKKGYALFRVGQEDPVEVKPVPAKKVAVKADNEVTLFTIPDNPLNYCIRPYNLVIGDDGAEYYFYGLPIGDFVKNIRVSYGQYTCTLPFDYDEYGRIITAGSINYMYGDNYVSINGSTFGFPYAATEEARQWYITFNDEGGIQGGTIRSTGDSVLTISPGFTTATLQDAHNHFLRFTYTGGNLTHLLEHGEIPKPDDQYDIFDHDYSFQYGSRRNPASAVDIVNYSLGSLGWTFPPFIVLTETTNSLLPTKYSFESCYNGHHSNVEYYPHDYILDNRGRIASFSSVYMTGVVEYYEDDFQ